MVPTSTTRRRRATARRVAAVAALLCTAGCLTAPPIDDQSALRGLRKVLAIDLGKGHTEAHANRLFGLPDALRRELQFQPSTALWPSVVAGAAKRPARLVADSRRLFLAELRRRPGLPIDAVPKEHEFLEAVGEGGQIAADLVFGAHRPMSELDDRRHRTDVHDDHPEKSWWQRLRRRLWL